MEVSRTGLIVSLAAAGALLWAALNFQSLRDRLVLLSYSPPAEIASVAKRTSMTSKGRDLFYVADPSIDDRRAFNAHCPKREAGLNVLGCYRGGIISPGKISLFRIEDKDLVDEIDVTAAHEMLHAAYVRLSYFERQKIDDMLAAAVANLPRDQLTEVIKNYVRERNFNELHSHLGTEYKQLPPELERYYSRYFENRQVIVAIHLSNEELFDQCERQEGSQRAALASTKSSLEATRASLDSIRAQMDQHLRNGETESYNALVPRHNSLVVQHNNTVNHYNFLARSYNSLIGRCNALSLSLDSEIKLIQTVPTR